MAARGELVVGFNHNFQALLMCPQMLDLKNPWYCLLMNLPRLTPSSYLFVN